MSDNKANEDSVVRCVLQANGCCRLPCNITIILLRMVNGSLVPRLSYHSCPYTKRHMCTLYPNVMAWPEGSTQQTLANEPKLRMFSLVSSKK